MSLTRRLTAGLPAVGVTALAALALSGSPAAATGDESAARAKPAVMATPCSEVPRGEKCDYGNDAGQTPDDNGASPDDNGASPDDNGASPDDVGTGPTRGSGGYGSESPTPSPSTPIASVDTVPPGGESPGTSPAPSKDTAGGVSAGGSLPLTGAPMGLIAALGGLMVAGGATAVFSTRRRRSA